MLPVVSKHPNIKESSSRSVILEWTAWSSETDEGDAPVVGYTVYVTSNTTGGWEKHVDANSTIITVDGLEPNTTYEIRVAAVREGEGGTGHPSPPTFATTLPPGEIYYQFLYFSNP